MRVIHVWNFSDVILGGVVFSEMIDCLCADMFTKSLLSSRFSWWASYYSSVTLSFLKECGYLHKFSCRR